MRLKCDFGLTGTDLISADTPTALPEARAALQAGKQPVKLGLVLGASIGEFRLTLDAERFTVTGLVVPEPDGSDGDERGRLEQRFESTADAASLLDALYEQFLLQRVAADWDVELEEMSAWARGQKRVRRQAVSA
jgi:hypothetical protein